jgi:hypothetical protein
MENERHWRRVKPRQPLCKLDARRPASPSSRCAVWIPLRLLPRRPRGHASSSLHRLSPSPNLPMAVLTAATTPAAAPAAARGNDRHPRHRVAAPARRSRSGAPATARRLELRASVSPAVTADAPNEAAAAVSALWSPPSRWCIPSSRRRAPLGPHGPRQVNTVLVSGTSGGTGAGDEAEQAGVSNLLLPLGERERSVRVSADLPIFVPPHLTCQLLTAASRFGGFFFSVVLRVSSVLPAKNPTPISRITGTLQWQLVRLSTRSPNRPQRNYSGNKEVCFLLLEFHSLVSLVEMRGTEWIIRGNWTAATWNFSVSKLCMIHWIPLLWWAWFT